MKPADYIGILVLVLAIGAEILGVWIVPRLGLRDPMGGLLGALLAGGLVGGLIVWALTRGRGR